MKLQSIETFVVGNPPPSRGGRYFIFVQLHTACGIVGVGEIYNATFSPKHRWYYFPKMARDEAALIKGYDSATDGRARFTLHTAFDDPTTPDDAAPRQSIEIRSFAFFDE